MRLCCLFACVLLVACEGALAGGATDGPMGGTGFGGNANNVGGTSGTGGSEDTRGTIDPPPQLAPPCDETTATAATTGAGLSVLHRDGQSFVTWTDRALAEAGAAYRYRLYRSDNPITADADLADAELIATRIPNHSGQMVGEGYRPEHRVDATRPTALVEEGGQPLPLWSGLWVVTAQDNGCSFYAVLATDADDVPVESIVPDVNATVHPVAELWARPEPILIWESAERASPDASSTRITGTPNLPLVISLHGSNAGGGPVVGGSVGDYYTFFGNRDMGYQDGLGGMFAVHEKRGADFAPKELVWRGRDTIEAPAIKPLETFWMGYASTSLYTGERLAYPYTENRLDWIVPWTITKYQADPNRVYVVGTSMGAWGSMTYAARRPGLFAAIYPNMPRTRQVDLPEVLPDGQTRVLRGDAHDGMKTPSGALWSEHYDTVRFVREHPGDLPFIGWNIGRTDGFASWPEQVDLVHALTAMNHGFAFAWNDAGHGGAEEQRAQIRDWYPPERFALNQSYPAFANSSIDDDLGTGMLDDQGTPQTGDDRAVDGDPVGGINLGFVWNVDEDSAATWVLTLSNELATGEMTVDVTPRRLQQFVPEVGEEVSFSTSRGDSGTVTVRSGRRMTVQGVRLLPGSTTVVTLRR